MLNVDVLQKEDQKEVVNIYVAVLCYALEEFTRFDRLPDSLSCTDKL